ncbi:MAG: DinB family protein, partial [Nocardioidaceae bacterium]
MSSAELLGDAFGRINSLVHHGVDGLTLEQLTFTPDPDANSISWLIWHLTRIEDDHIAGVADIEQVWLSSQWRVRFDLPFEPTATGYGHGASEVAAVVVDAERLVGYQDAVYEQTRRFVGGLQESDLPRIVD